MLDDVSRDLIIRTLYGEAASDPDSQAAVAHVIKNRMDKTKTGAKDVVLAPNQFEPWGSRKAELEGLDPKSPIYEGLGGVVDNVWGGQTPDPTGGATLFYAPKAQASLGRKAPAWDTGNGVDIGQHRFFAGNFPTPKAATTITAGLGPSLGSNPPMPSSGITPKNLGSEPNLTPYFLAPEAEAEMSQVYIQALLEAGIPPEHIKMFIGAMQNG